MTSINTSQSAWRKVAGAFLLSALVSCGGVGSDGSGMTADGATDGTVNGFGSVIVDGLSYDDRHAAVVSEVAPGSDVISQVKLGQRVSVQFETPGVAKQVRVDASLAGPVESVHSATEFSMLGQTVLVNTNGVTGPITQFGGGYSGLSDMHPGDAAEVHGLLVRKTSSYVIQATRIDKLSAVPAFLRATGIVSNSGATFTLGALTVDATGATRLPAGIALGNGQAVTLLAPAASLQMLSPTTWKVVAAQVRVQALRDQTLDRRVSGALSHLNASAKTFALGGLTVNYASATVSPASTVLADSLYVVARGTAAPDGTLIASSVTVRDAGSDTEAELHGDISGYNAVTSQFVVRGVSVDASTALFEGCPVGGLTDGLYVEVEGRVGSTGVIAKSVHCQGEPSGATVERKGVAGSVDPVGKTFTLTRPSAEPVRVMWSNVTYFSHVSVSTLPGSTVEVQGVFVDGVLLASKVERED